MLLVITAVCFVFGFIGLMRHKNDQQCEMAIVLLLTSLVCLYCWTYNHAKGYPVSVDGRESNIVYRLVDIIEHSDDTTPVTLRRGDGSLVAIPEVNDTTRLVVARELNGKLRLFKLSSDDQITSQTTFFETVKYARMKYFFPVDSLELKFNSGGETP